MNSTAKKLKNAKQDLSDLQENERRQRQKQEEIQELEEQLSEEKAAEQRQDAVDELIELAKEAEKMQQEYWNQLQELDENLLPIIKKLTEIKSKWTDVAREFMSNAHDVAPDFENRYNESIELSDAEKKRLAEELLEEIESEGVSAEPVRTEYLLNKWPKYRRMSNKPVDSDNFTFWDSIHAMMKHLQYLKQKAQRENE